MKFTGKIEVFKNSRGYLTAVLKAFSKENELLGKHYVDASAEGLEVSENETVTLDVTEGYVNVIAVKSGDKQFTKLNLAVVKFEEVSRFKPKAKKKSKKAGNK